MTEALRSRLVNELGSCVATDAETLAAHRHDRWVLSDLLHLEGTLESAPLAVVHVESVGDVQRTLRICRELRLPVVPFGGGSGVCGAIRPGEGAVVLSTRRLDGLIELDDKNLTASFRAGTLGIEAEQRVQQRGLTIGHWPQSIEISTVGGWVATRAAGQYSTAYGNIEDMVLSLEAVLPDGSLLRTRATPRSATGPELRHLFMGSEGTLGVVTEVTFSLRALPEQSQGQAMHFPSFAAGLETIRLLMREGWRPPVVRLYDARESPRHFPEWCPEGRHMLILLHEGPAAAVAAELEGVARLGRDAGGLEADAASVGHWLEQRNRVPTLRDLLEKGIVADTIEVACTWDRVAQLHEQAVASLSEVPDLLVASAHSSHSYRSGTNLYITFAVRPGERGHMAAAYRECWERVMKVTVGLGAGISHHHGVGRVRRDRLQDEIGETGVALLWAIKRALDPDELLNPGALLPDRPRTKT